MVLMWPYFTIVSDGRCWFNFLWSNKRANIFTTGTWHAKDKFTVYYCSMVCWFKYINLGMGFLAMQKKTDPFQGEIHHFPFHFILSICSSYLCLCEKFVTRYLPLYILSVIGFFVHTHSNHLLSIFDNPNKWWSMVGRFRHVANRGWWRDKI